MKIVITAGPAWTPIDGMRRVTNASTGRLGTILAEALSAAGHEVALFRGDGSTAAPPQHPAVRVATFSTNADLEKALREAAASTPADAVLHAAALCDFEVARALDEAGRPLAAGKIPSRGGKVFLELAPAPKVLPKLREIFPRARICGWKYELDGGREQALAAAWRQFHEVRVEACVLNGRAWGEGFAFCEPPDRLRACADARALSDTILAWLKQR